MSANVVPAAAVDIAAHPVPDPLAFASLAPIPTPNPNPAQSSRAGGARHLAKRRASPVDDDADVTHDPCHLGKTALVELPSRVGTNAVTVLSKREEWARGG